MRDKALIDRVIKSIKSKEYSFRIMSYLRASGMNDDQAKEFIEKAKEEHNRRARLEHPAKNKKLFFLFGAIAILVFILAIFVIPYQNITHTTIVGIILTVLFVASASLTLLFRNSYKMTEEELEATDFSQPNDYSESALLLGAVGLIPGVIIFFIFSWQMGNGQDYLLKTNGIKTTATIIDGQSTTYGGRRRVTYTDITIRYFTEDLTPYTVKEDVSQYELKQFYKGQVIEIMYLPSNPENIVLLTNKGNKKEFLETEERDLGPRDLINLLELENDGMIDKLNAINYGWEFNAENESWVNNGNQTVITKSRGTLFYITTKYIVSTFDNQLTKLGYSSENVKTSRNPFAVDTEYENDEYKFVVATMSVSQESITYSVMVTKK